MRKCLVVLFFFALGASAQLLKLPDSEADIAALEQNAPSIFKTPTKYSASELFARHRYDIYQIRAINAATSQKVSIGSGFVVRDRHTLATNYHVISDAIHEKNIRLEYVSGRDQVGQLQIIAVDVIHDLAILHSDDDLGAPFEIGELPAQGDPLYALGNPHDLGFIIIDGINNGRLKKSARDHVLFSGSLNAGMSGGPTMDERGLVVGVNVSYLRRGSDISFIVPSEFLTLLLQKTGLADQKSLKEQIAQQIYHDNEAYFNTLLHKDWGSSQISHFKLPTEISDDIRCWDASQRGGSEDDNVLDAESVVCYSDRNTFISNDIYFSTLMMQYTSAFAKKEMLVPRFYRLYSELFNLEGFYRSKDDFEKYRCLTDFQEIASRSFKVVLCEQASKDYVFQGDPIGDASLILAEIGESNSGVIIKVQISGIQFSLARRFFAKLLEEIAWNPS